MENDRQRILKMLQEGKVSVEEAESLLDALGSGKETETRAEPQEEALETGPKIRGAGDFGDNLGTGIERWVTGLVNKFTGGALGPDDGKSRSNLGQMTVTKEYLLGMEDGASLKNLGQMTIADDVPADLVRQKVGRLTNLGDISGPGEVLSALQSRCAKNLGAFRPTDSSNQRETESVTNEGSMQLTKGYLERLQDGITFVNEGSVKIAEDVPEELILQKIGEYVNEGDTRGPDRLLDALQSRCKCNEGDFTRTD